MKRIEPATIARFFSRSLMEPVQRSFVRESEVDEFEDVDDDIVGCCVLTAALLIHEETHPCHRDFMLDELTTVGVETGSIWIADLLDMDHPYAIGLIHGWDETVTDDDDPAYLDGVKDGRAAWLISTES